VSQTSVRKVETISHYLGELLWIPIAAMSPGKVDERAKRHEDQANRERFEKDTENPRKRFGREAAKAAFERASALQSRRTIKTRRLIRRYASSMSAGAEKEPSTPPGRLLVFLASEEEAKDPRVPPLPCSRAIHALSIEVRLIRRVQKAQAISFFVNTYFQPR